MAYIALARPLLTGLMQPLHGEAQQHKDLSRGTGWSCAMLEATFQQQCVRHESSSTSYKDTLAADRYEDTLAATVLPAYQRLSACG